MMTQRVGVRLVAWSRTETRKDVLASLGALGVAGVSVLAFALSRSF